MSNQKKDLEILQNATKKNQIKVWIPSRKDYMYFNPLSVKHQKLLTKAAVNVRELQTTIYEVLRELNNEVPSLKTTDLNSILVTLRASCMSETYDGINLQSVISKYETLGEPPALSEVEEKIGDVVYTITLVNPSLRKDYEFQTYFKEFAKTDKGDKESNLSSAFAEMIQISVATNIANISVYVDGESHKINFEMVMGAKNKLELLEALPSKLLSTIMNSLKPQAEYGNLFLALPEGKTIKFTENFFIITPNN